MNIVLCINARAREREKERERNLLDFILKIKKKDYVKMMNLLFLKANNELFIIAYSKTLNTFFPILLICHIRLHEWKAMSSSFICVYRTLTLTAISLRRSLRRLWNLRAIVISRLKPLSWFSSRFAFEEAPSQRVSRNMRSARRNVQSKHSWERVLWTAGWLMIMFEARIGPARERNGSR